jgi:exodeoxyribonuclease V gamma subunit
MMARLLADLAKPAADVLGAEPLHVFGLAHLAPVELDVLRAVAGHRPVVLYVPDPCREFWGGLRTDRQRLRDLLRQDPDASATQVAFLEQDHPLARGLGPHGPAVHARARRRRRRKRSSATGRTSPTRHTLDTRLHRLQESIRQLKPELIGAKADFEPRAPTVRCACTPATRACANSRYCATRCCARVPTIRPSSLPPSSS